MAELRYREIPERLRAEPLGSPAKVLAAIARAVSLVTVGRPPANRDGDVEMLGTTRAVHRFVHAPGDGGSVRWHLVESGEGEPVVLLHGVPDSWWAWHHVMEDLARDHRVVAIDLKGCGQSEKTPGDYRPEGVAEQIVALLDALGLERTNLVTHGLGSTIGDHLGARHPFRVRRYVRGQQHLWDFHAALARDERCFGHPWGALLLRCPAWTVAATYAAYAHHPVPAEDLWRIASEWSHPGIGAAAARYFQSSSAEREWAARRSRLLPAWRFPVLLLQGEHDPGQPREFYDGAVAAMPDATLRFLDAGRFFALENPHQTTRVIREFLAT